MFDGFQSNHFPISTRSTSNGFSFSNSESSMKFELKKNTHKITMSRLSIPILIFNTVLCVLGLRIQLIDYHFVKTSVQHRFSRLSRRYRLKYLSIAFLILYLYKYQSTVSVMENENRKSVQFFISYAFYNGKYVILITIYFFQYWNQQKLRRHQKKIKQMFMELWTINRYLRTKYEKIDRDADEIWYETFTRSTEDTYTMKQITLDVINVFSYQNIAQMVILLIVYIITNQPR